MVLVASNRTAETDNLLLVALKAFVVHQAPAGQINWLFQDVEIQLLLLMDLQSEKVANERRYLEFLLADEDLCESEDVVKDNLAYFTASFLHVCKDIRDLLQNEG